MFTVAGACGALLLSSDRCATEPELRNKITDSENPRRLTAAKLIDNFLPPGRAAIDTYILTQCLPSCTSTHHNGEHEGARDNRMLRVPKFAASRVPLS